MKKTLLLGLLCLGLCALALNAAAPATVAVNDTAEDETADIQDVLYLGQPHPVMIRLRLRVDRKSAFAHWEACLGKFFAYLDRNNSKALERSEAARAPTAQQMLQLMQGNPYIYNGARGRPGMGQGVPLTEFDADRDGKVTMEEFVDYYTRNGAGPITLQTANTGVNRSGFNPGYGQGPGQDLTDAVFTALDANKDGKLSRAELLAAETVLRKYDNDDDEMVTMGELGLARQGRGRRIDVEQQAAVRRPPKQPAAKQPSNLLLISRDDSGKQMAARLKIARELITSYDKDKDGSISASEIGFSEETFASIDRNKDGKLTALELGRWLAGKPAGEFTLRMYDQGGATRRQAMMAPGKNKKNDPSVALDGVRINVVAPPANMAFRNDQFLIQQFDQIDVENKGFITLRQVENDGQALFLRGMFDLSDRDADGKLTEKEFKAVLKLFGDMRGAQLHVAMASTGQGLFQMIDHNGDGRLSVRELRNVWNRLASVDTNKDGHVSKTEFPQQFQLTVSQGPNYGFTNQNQGQTATATPLAGPLWFRKMDRNADGDVSLSEWLGTKEQFAEVDTDKDGLIGLEEAEAYDARARTTAE